MKQTIIALLLLFPLQLLACSNGAYYVVNARNSITLAYVMGGLLILSLLMRILRGGKRLYFPLIIALSASIVPIAEVFRWGNGDCGFGLYEMMTYSVAVMMVMTFYELVLTYLWKHP